MPIDFTHICLSDDESIMACLTSHGHVYVRTKATCRKLPGTANSLGLSSDGKKIIVARNKEGTITIRRYKTNALEEPKAEFRIKVHDIVHKNLVRFDKGLLHKYSTLQPKILMHPNKKHFCILSSFFFLHNFQGKLECLTDLSVTNENGHIFADGSLHIWGHVIPKINYFVKKFDHQLQQHTQEIIREPLYPDLIPCYLKMHHDDPQAFYTSWNDTESQDKRNKELHDFFKVIGHGSNPIITLNKACTTAFVGSYRYKSYDLESYFAAKRELEEDNLNTQQQALLLICNNRNENYPPLQVGQYESYRTLPDWIKQCMTKNMNVTVNSFSTLEILSNGSIDFYYKAKAVTPYLLGSVALAAGAYGLKKLLKE